MPDFYSVDVGASPRAFDTGPGPCADRYVLVVVPLSLRGCARRSASTMTASVTSCTPIALFSVFEVTIVLRPCSVPPTGSLSLREPEWDLDCSYIDLESFLDKLSRASGPGGSYSGSVLPPDVAGYGEDDTGVVQMGPAHMRTPMG